MSETTELGIIITGTDRASGPLGAVGTALGEVGSSATRLGQDLLPLSVAGAAVAGSALLMAADYEQAMNVLAVQSGATAEQMRALDETAIALGADVKLPGTSALDASEAMLELSKAGLSVNDTLGAARGVLEMSAAGQISNAEAATIAANALNVFGLEGSEASRVADLLAAAANASSADVKGMADSLKMVGSVAAMSGQSIEDTTTAIALMANAGIAGSDAGTSLKTMLLSLQAPTGKAAELMEALGISVYDANGTMLPMPKLIEQFSGALGPLSQEQRNAALAAIFGTDAVRAANTVLLGGRDAFDAMKSSVTAAGSAQELAAAQTAGFKGSMEGLKSTIETTLMTGARPLLDTLSQMVGTVANVIGQFAAANPQLVTAGIAFAGVLAVASPLLLAIGFLAPAIGALLSPIGLVIVAVGLLAAAWTTNFGGIRETTAGLATQISTMLPAIRDWITGAWEAIRAKTLEVWEAVRGSTEAAWNAVLTAVQTIITALRGVIEAVFGVITTFLSTHGADIQATLTGAWNTIMSIVQTVAQIIQTVVTAVFGAIQSFIGEHGAQIQAILTAAWNVIKGIIETTLGVIKGIVTAVLAALKGDWSGAWEAMRGVAQTLWTGIRGIIENAINAIKGVLGLTLDAIKGILSSAWESIKGVTQGAWTAVQNLVMGPVNAMEAALTGALGRIKSTFVGTWESIRDSVIGIVQNIVGWITGAFSGFKIHIPMPHFNVSWNDIGFGISLPSVGVDWYRKGGDFVADGPMLIGVGEAGPERVQITPMDKRASGDGSGQGVTVNIYNPVIREELDLQRLAEAVGAMFAEQTDVNVRMNRAWAAG